MTDSCHACGDVLRRTFPEYQKFSRMTSDCRPWPKGGTLVICESCGLLQPIVNTAWRSEVDRIYQDYDIQLLRDEADQAVIVAGSRPLCSRSDALIDWVRERVGIPESGRLLDVGCGNGAFLRAFHRAYPGWTLCGAERSDSGDSAVLAIDGVEALYTGAAEDIPGSFDLIVSVHSLEHIPEPVPLINTLACKLNEGGHLVLQLPYFFRNPFYLCVADHCSHFTHASLVEMLRRSGFEAVDATTNYIPKEITVIARKADPRHVNHVDDQAIHAVEQMLGWLASVSKAARDARAGGRFGLWGSSVSATWLFAELEGQVDFFVDDDVGRQGKTFMDRPVLAPTQVPAGSRVFLGLAPAVANRIAKRMQGSGVELPSPGPLMVELPSTELAGA